MARFLAELLKNISKVEITPQLKPPDEVGSEETVVGTVSDPQIRALFALKFQLGQRMREAKATQISKVLGNPRSVDNEMLRRFADERYELVTRYQIVDLLLWACLREETGIKNKTVGIRKGWQIITCEDAADYSDPLAVAVSQFIADLC